MSKQQLLGEDAAGRKNANLSAALPPSFKGAQYVGVDVASDLARLKTFFPYLALNGFQRCRFSVAVHEPKRIIHNAIDLIASRAVTPSRAVGFLFGGMLAC